MSEIENFIFKELEWYKGYYWGYMLEIASKLEYKTNSKFEEDGINECLDINKKFMFLNIIKKYVNCKLKNTDYYIDIDDNINYLFLQFNNYICDINFNFKNFEFNNIMEMLDDVLNNFDLILKYMKLKNIAPKININSKNKYVNYYVEIIDIKGIKKYVALNDKINLLLMNCESKNLFNYLDKKIKYNFEEFKNKYLN